MRSSCVVTCLSHCPLLNLSFHCFCACLSPLLGFDSNIDKWCQSNHKTASTLEIFNLSWTLKESHLAIFYLVRNLLQCSPLLYSNFSPLNSCPGPFYFPLVVNGCLGGKNNHCRSYLCCPYQKDVCSCSDIPLSSLLRHFIVLVLESQCPFRLSDAL